MAIVDIISTHQAVATSTFVAAETPLAPIGPQDFSDLQERLFHEIAKRGGVRLSSDWKLTIMSKASINNVLYAFMVSGIQCPVLTWHWTSDLSTGYNPIPTFPTPEPLQFTYWDFADDEITATLTSSILGTCDLNGFPKAKPTHKISIQLESGQRKLVFDDCRLETPQPAQFTQSADLRSYTVKAVYGSVEDSFSSLAKVIAVSAFNNTASTLVETEMQASKLKQLAAIRAVLP